MSNLRQLCVLCLCLALPACSAPGADAPFATYLDRLARTLSVDSAPVPAAAPVPRAPRPGELRLRIPADSIGVLDFLDLHGCELQVTIGKRNSSLGRLAADSQRLLLELEFLRLAPACIASLRGRGKATLAAHLEAAWNDKRSQLPRFIFNATLGGAEYRRFWHPAPPNPDYPGNTGGDTAQALRAIDELAARWLAGDYRADNQAFELLLSRVDAGDGGQLWAALAHQATWLAAADTTLAARSAGDPLCHGPFRPAAADILPNVIRLFFIDGIQPRAAALGRRYHELLPPVQSLENRLQAVLPDDYRRWQALRASQLDDYTSAPKRHVAALQSLLEPCGGATGGQ